jgi:hypothetical protein
MRSIPFPVVRNRTTARRRLARIATLAFGIAAPVLTVATPALALHRDDGGSTGGPSLGAGMTIFYFVVIPVGAFLAIAALSLLPSALSRPRYRPGKPWEFGARWFGSAEPGDDTGSGGSARGGASAEW